MSVEPPRGGCCSSLGAVFHDGRSLKDCEHWRQFSSRLTPDNVFTASQGIELAAFQLLFAFDEVISLGYKENVTVQQVKQVGPSATACIAVPSAAARLISNSCAHCLHSICHCHCTATPNLQNECETLPTTYPRTVPLRRTRRWSRTRRSCTK